MNQAGVRDEKELRNPTLGKVLSNVPALVARHYTYPPHPRASARELKPAGSLAASVLLVCIHIAIMTDLYLNDSLPPQRSLARDSKLSLHNKTENTFKG